MSDPSKIARSPVLTKEQTDIVRRWQEHDDLIARWGREGWIGWNGGKCPLPDDQDVEVEVRYRDGSCLCGPIEMFVWEHGPTPLGIDIVAYWILPDELQEGAA